MAVTRSLAFIALVLGSILHGRTVDAQLQQGSIHGSVLLPDGALADSAVVTLLDPLGGQLATATVISGSFTLPQVPIGIYTLRAEAPPLQATLQQLAVTSAVPVKVQLRLSAVASEQVDVHGGDQPAATTRRVTLGGDAVRRAAARLRSRSVQDAIATTPGWATEDNGLLHVRGVDDGFLYVIDGIPVYERLDGLFGMAPDPAMVDTLNVVTGYIPPEFGWKSGGVLELRSATRTDDRWSGAFDVGGGADRTRDVAAVGGGPAGRHTAFTLGLARQTSSRFLDPVHPDNLHNDGGSWNGGGQFAWNLAPTSTLTAVAGIARSTFDVPNTDEQEEAGQDQRQRTRQYSLSLSWQRAWANGIVSQVSQYSRWGSSAVNGSDADTPLFTEADRTLRRVGLLVSVAHQRGSHLIKAGAEVSTLRLRENFLFAVTDPDEGEEADLSDAALEFTPGRPFVFAGAAAPTLFAAYVQDSIRLARDVTLDVGVRVDWSRLLARASQVSPRLGAAYRLPMGGTTVRASIGRFFQPPQPENLLLASSAEAWELSPFRESTAGGGELEPERQTAFEVAISQPLAGRLRLDIAYWKRRMTDVADPNVFFGTTILFPNSVAKGRASGFDLRLEIPRRRGWSGYLSYANSRVVQFGPIEGGLFLEDEVIEIGPGTAFIPDHDQRNVGAFGVSFDADARGFWATFSGRYESGTPLEVDEEEHDELMERPGAELVDFDRGRVKPRTVLDASASQRILRTRGLDLSVRASILNLTGRRWAYNFGNPFSGTHFGPGRTFQVGLRLVLK
jgi:hypothetical protein